LYPYVEKEQNRQEVLRFVKKEKKDALRKGDIAKAADLNKIAGVIESGGGILKHENPYVVFTQECIAQRPDPKKPLTLGETQRLMKTCAQKWNKMDEKEKKRFSSGRLEAVNLP
jgi:hypothetical protein